MANIRVDLDHTGVQSLLLGAGVRKDLERRAAAVAASAGPGVMWIVQRGPDRLRAAIWTETWTARRREAHNHVLMSALAAAG